MVDYDYYRENWIRNKAYKLYEKRKECGFSDDQDADWLMAEEEWYAGILHARELRHRMGYD